MKKKYTFRQFINDVHLWLGLPSAVVLFVMCLSGTLYVFQKDITKWADADKLKIEVADKEKLLSMNQLKSIVEKEKKATVTAIEIPQYADEAWTFSTAPKKKLKGAKPKTDVSKKKVEKPAAKKEKTKDVWVNPYTGEIQGNTDTKTAAFFATVLKLHRWLLIEDHDIGGAITGTAAIMMLFLQITGIMLWAPAKFKNWQKWQNWKHGFKVKTDAKFKRINFDLHKASGFYAFLLVTIMAITGPYFAFKWYKTSLAAILGTEPVNNENKKKSTILPGAKPIALEGILSKVNEIYPYQGNTRINLPKDSLGTFTILKSKSGFFASAGIDRATLDQYSGEVLVLNDFASKSLADKLVSSAKYIHTGEIFGTFTKILYFIACLIATSLPVTGFLIWLKRGKSESKVKRPVNKRILRSGELSS